MRLLRRRPEPALEELSDDEESLSLEEESDEELEEDESLSESEEPLEEPLDEVLSDLPEGASAGSRCSGVGTTNRFLPFSFPAPFFPLLVPASKAKACCLSFSFFSNTLSAMPFLLKNSSGTSTSLLTFAALFGSNSCWVLVGRDL